MRLDLVPPNSDTEPRHWVRHDQAFAMMWGPGSIEWGAKRSALEKFDYAASDLALCDRHQGEWVGLMKVPHLQLGISDAALMAAYDEPNAYSLLYLALKESGYVALATVAMHGREHVVVVRPGAKGLLAHTMFYQDEVRAEDEFETGVSEVAPKELQLARTFIEAIAGPFAPEEFADSHRKKLEALISAKLSRGEVAANAPAAKSTARTLDILEALRKSIEQNQRSRKAESTMLRREPGRVTEIKKPKKRHA